MLNLRPPYKDDTTHSPISCHKHLNECTDTPPAKSKGNIGWLLIGRFNNSHSAAFAYIPYAVFLVNKAQPTAIQGLSTNKTSRIYVHALTKIVL